VLETIHQALEFVETTHQLSLPYSVLSNRPFYQSLTRFWFELPGHLLIAAVVPANFST
jgi:hypothetical protein